MRVTMLLADAAKVAEGKLYVLGGGWSITGPGPTSFAIALKIEVPWNQAGQRHKVVLDLLDADGQPVNLGDPNAPSPLRIEAEFEVGKPVGVPDGTPIDLPMVLDVVGRVPFPPGGRYVFSLSIDGYHDEDWELAFTTRSEALAA